MTSTGNTPSADPGRETRPAYKTGELLVKFNPDVGDEARAALHARIGSVMIRRLKISGLERVKLRAGLDEDDAIRLYRDSGLVETAGKNHLRYPLATPNDPYFSSQWGMKKIGMENVWNITTGSRDVIIAVIDSGVDYNHPDLQGNIWINAAEQNGQPDRDDDGNGYTDDIYGWDFAGYDDGNPATYDGDSDPMDSYGHGTHVAGIIGATGNNGVGVTGLNWTVRIMSLKVMEDSSSGFTESAIIEAIDYAMANGAQVVNCSFGGTENSLNEYDAYDRLRAAGTIASIAAGNDRNNMDLGNKIYPACYNVDNICKDDEEKDVFCPGLDNVLSIANSDTTDAIASSSNYGKTTVDVAAPGTSIYSTLPLPGTIASVRTIETATPAEYPAIGMAYAAVTTDAGISGTLYDCGMGYPDQIPTAVAGNIALIQQGNNDGTAFYFYEKAANAQDAGAAGIIFYNNVTDNFDTNGGTLGSDSNWVPAVSVTMVIGDALKDLPPATRKVTLINKPFSSSYGDKSGTSMAAPHVAGLAGMILGRCPSVGYADVKAAIIDSSDKIPDLAEKTASGGRINAFAALTSLFPPGDLSADCRVGLEDAIIALKIIAGIETPLACPLPDCTRHDIDNDGRITAAEVIYILQNTAGLR